MAYNKVVFGSEDIIDLTNDTVTADLVAKGETFHLKSGVIATGTLVTGLYIDVNDPTDMDNNLTIENVGRTYHYIGTDETKYKNNDLYVVTKNMVGTVYYTHYKLAMDYDGRPTLSFKLGMKKIGTKEVH